MALTFRAALDSLPAYTPGRNVPGAIKLASNEVPYPVLPAVSAAVTAAIGDADPAAGVHRYPDNGATALVTEVAGLLGVSADRVVAGCGSVALCQQLAQAVAGPGDEVVFGWRSFEAYPIVTGIVGATPVRVPVTGDHRLDLAAMAAAMTDATRLMFVCTPNNPTGTAVEAGELEALLDTVPDRVLVVIDEAYREFDNRPDAPDGVEIAGRHANVVALRTLSKAYGLAGLRVGYAVGHPDTVAALSKVAIPFAVSSLAQVAAVAALRSRAELQPRWAEVIGERDRVAGVLRDADFAVPESRGNFSWLPLGPRAADFAQHCEERGVIVRAFPDQAGGVRVTTGRAGENDAFLDAALSWPR